MKKCKIYSESCVIGTQPEIIKLILFTVSFEWIVSLAYKDFNIPILIPDTAARQAGRQAGWEHKAVGTQHTLVSFPNGILEIYFWFLLPWYNL